MGISMIVSIMIWCAMGYLSGWSDGKENENKGLIRCAFYILLMIFSIVALKIYEGTLLP